MLKKFLSFEKMITPTIIKLLFLLAIVVSIIMGIAMMIHGARAEFGGGREVLGGVVLLFAGPLVARVYCELFIVVFTINKNLGEVKKELAKIGESGPQIPD